MGNEPYQGTKAAYSWVTGTSILGFQNKIAQALLFSPSPSPTHGQRLHHRPTRKYPPQESSYIFWVTSVPFCKMFTLQTQKGYVAMYTEYLHMQESPFGAHLYTTMSTWTLWKQMQLLRPFLLYPIPRGSKYSRNEASRRPIP